MRITFTKQLAAAAIALTALVSVAPSGASAAPSVVPMSIEAGAPAHVIPAQYYGGRREAFRREQIRRERERERARHYRRYERRYGH